MEYKHKPVLETELVGFLPLKENIVFVDGTLGGGGHSKSLLKKFARKKIKCKIIGIDRDLEAIFAAKKNLADFKDKMIYIHDNFSNIEEILKSQGVSKIDGIFLDLGVSSYQLENDNRGFSFQTDSPLDMRMDQDDDLTAGEIINYYDEKSLANLFYNYGEERYSRSIARKITNARKTKLIKSTFELVEIIKSATPPKYRFPDKKNPNKKIHFATRVFQALRIEVNSELNELKAVIEKAVNLLNVGGEIIIISFHSLEDRIVKHSFKAICEKEPEKFTILTKKPITATAEEIAINPRSRSAKLRAIKKIK